MEEGRELVFEKLVHLRRGAPDIGRRIELARLDGDAEGLERPVPAQALEQLARATPVRGLGRSCRRSIGTACWATSTRAFAAL